MLKKNIALFNVSQICFAYFMFFTSVSFSQVGIGTTDPDPSSILDITSTTQGLLPPRMTNIQRTAIASPANGLMVFDTTSNAYYYYNSATTSWNKIVEKNEGRKNYKLIKSTDALATVLASELAAGSGLEYKLNSETYYEINGIIVVDKPINLNNAMLVGVDAFEDKLIKTSGNLFEGNTGGVVSSVTIVVSGNGSKVFNIDCSSNPEQIVFFRDCIVANSKNVGLLKGINHLIIDTFNFAQNDNGITFENINNLFLKNLIWFDNNLGTYETFVGLFNLIQNLEGYMNLSGNNIGVDVSTNPTILFEANMKNIVFSGTLTSGQYVKPYTVGNSVEWNFNHKWDINCTGIPIEGDAHATGSVYLNRTLTFPTTTVPTTGFTKMPGTTIGINLKRVTCPISNRLVYDGEKARTFSIYCSVSFDSGGGGDADYLFFIVKWNATGTTSTILTNTETYIDTNSGNIQSFPITGTVLLSKGEYIELAMVRKSGSDKTLTFKSMNMSLK